MKLLLVTDAWRPQVNGVVRTYENTVIELGKAGVDVCLVTPDRFVNLPCPTYPDIRLAILPARKLARIADEYGPDAVHIATEGPLGHAARLYCLRRHYRFSSSFHTRFPEYLRLRLPVPVDWSYRYLRHFHGVAENMFVPTDSQRRNLEERGFNNIVVWGRGVDTGVFQPGADLYQGLPGPVFVTAGRVAVEKNIREFLDLELPGSKVVVGDGPDLARLRLEYPGVIFTGYKFGRELADHIASADVFVFPSRTDTFGIVLLEAMACGVPVAAYPVTGPVDVVQQGVTGILDTDLRRAALQALHLDPGPCIDYARTQSWRECTAVFRDNLVAAR